MKNLFYLLTMVLGLSLLSCTATKETTEKPPSEDVKAEVVERPQRGERPDRGNRGEWAARQEEENRKMVLLLNLEEAQTEKFMALNKKYQMAMRNARQANQGDREGMRAAMMDLRDRQDKELQSLLTVEQYKEFKRIQEEKRQQMRERRGDGQ